MQVPHLAQSNKLIISLKMFANNGQSARLDLRIHVDGASYLRMRLFGHIDILHDAMRRNLKVEFNCIATMLMASAMRPVAAKPHEVAPIRIAFLDG